MGKKVFEITDGDLLTALPHQLAEAGITSGGFVVIGAVDSFTLSTMRSDDPGKNAATTYTSPAEIHGTGEVLADGVAVHIHATLGMEGQTLAGHLVSAKVATWFCRVYMVCHCGG